MTLSRRLPGLVAWAFAWAVAGTAGAARDTHAAQSVRLALVAPIPFSAEEIGLAVGARLSVAPAADSAGVNIRVAVVGPADGAGIRVRLGQRAVIVAVGDRQGPPAARAVALVIADLAAEEIAPPLAPMARNVGGDGALLRRAATSPLPARAEPARARLTVNGGLSKGAGGQEPICYGLEADLVGRPIGRLRLGVGLGLLMIPHQDTPPVGGLSYTAGVARLLAEWRAGAFELLAGPFVSPYVVGGVSQHAGVLAGAGVIARLAPALSARLRLVVSARVDGYANRIHARWTANTGFATPRVDGGVSVGLAWELGS